MMKTLYFKMEKYMLELVTLIINMELQHLTNILSFMMNFLKEF